MPYGGTYLWRPERVDTSAWPGRYALALHVGEILLAAADLDANLTTLIAVLVSRDSPNRELAKGRFVNDKIRILEAVYPSHWRDTATFTKALQRVTQDRNSLAHAFWEPDLESLNSLDPNGEVPLVLQREKSKSGTPVDYEALYLTRVNIALLNVVCHDVTMQWAFGNLDGDFSIPEYVEGLAENPLYVGWPKTPEWAADVERVFPS